MKKRLQPTVKQLASPYHLVFPSMFVPARTKEIFLSQQKTTKLILYEQAWSSDLSFYVVKDLFSSIHLGHAKDLIRPDQTSPEDSSVNINEDLLIIWHIPSGCRWDIELSRILRHL